MNWDFEARTSEALDALEQGELVEAILSRYPEDADALRPILETAHELQTLPLAYSVSARQDSRKAMLDEARRLRGRPAPAITRFSAFRRLSFAFGSLLVLFVAAAALLAQPVSAALPGQALYPVKRAAETIQLRLAADPTVLETRFREERREELQALLAEGAEAEVDCSGAIRTFAEDRWQTDDFVLLITAESAVSGEPATGAPFEGRCLVRDGQVFAQDVRITGPGKLPPEPPTPSPAPPTPTPTPSVTPMATLTPTPTATVTPEAAPGGPVGPTVTPDDDDDDDGDDNGGDDNGDDNGGDGGDDDGDDGSDDFSDDSGDDSDDDNSGGSDDGDSDDSDDEGGSDDGGDEDNDDG